MRNLPEMLKSAGLLLGFMFVMSCTDHNEVREKVDTLKLLVKSNSLLVPSESDKYPPMHSIGVYSLSKDGEHTSLLDNQKAIYNGHRWYFDKNREVRLSTDSIQVYAYYPYDTNMQSNEWLRLKAGNTDYMYGFHDKEKHGYINYEQPLAEIKMEHAMSMLRLDVRPIIEEGGDIERIYIKTVDYNSPLYMTGQINMFTGETGSLEIMEEADCTLDNTGSKAILYLIPCLDAKFEINVIVNRKPYVLKITDHNFSPGKSYNFWLDFDVKEENLIIKDFTIEDWVDGGTLDMDTSVK